MYDSTAILYKDGTKTYDTYGNEIITRTSREVFVYARGVYNAAQAGLHPSITLVLTNRADYEGETLVEFEGKMYDVIRTDWTAQRDSMSLTLQERIDGQPAETTE